MRVYYPFLSKPSSSHHLPFPFLRHSPHVFSFRLFVTRGVILLPYYCAVWGGFSLPPSAFSGAFFLFLLFLGRASELTITRRVWAIGIPYTLLQLV